MSDLEDKAKQIADIINSIDTNLRGNLLTLAGDNLRLLDQFYTGNLVRSAGYEYGVNPKYPGHRNFEVKG